MTISKEAVIEVIADEAGLDVTKLSLDAKLAELDISSIDLASAVFTIEEKFGILVEPETIPPEATLGELVDLVLSQAKA